MPAVTLRTADGDSFDLNKAVSQQPSVLVFYRGGW
jgi:peroxiredoxin